jgi:hypothetical protein
MGRSGKIRKDATISDPTPARGGRSVTVAKGIAYPAGGTSLTFKISVPADGGMIRRRFPGFAKKRKTSLIGNGTHCSN